MDLLAQSYLKSYKVPIAIVRTSTIYGGGESAADPLIPSTIRSILKGKAPKLDSGTTSRRDYLYVKDAVAAFIKLGDSKDTGAFNLGTEMSTPDHDVVKKILTIMKSKLRPAIRKSGTGNLVDRRLSCAKVRKRLKWEPLHDLAKGLAETVTWHRKHPEGWRIRGRS